jgi:hypothetical protein
MRKIVGLLAGLTGLILAGTALAQSATNSNGQFLYFSLTATPPISSTHQTPRGVGLAYSEISGNRINANNEGRNTALSVRLNQNFTDNGLLFPSCAINPKALSVCSKASQIGTGTAEGAVITPGKPPSFIPATVKLYNGKPYKTKSPTAIFIVSLSGKPFTEIDFRVAKVHGGLTFTAITIPGAPAPSQNVALTKFAFKVPDRSETKRIHGKKVRIHLFLAPTICHGAWSFTQTLAYAGEAPLKATSSQPCVKG